MDETREEFLAGERPDEVLLYFNEADVDDLDRLASVGEPVADGVVLVISGDEGRAAFQRATGVDPMSLPNMAQRVEGAIDRDCTGGTCPDAGAESATTESSGDEPREGGDAHRVKFLFAFAEEQNEAVGDIYAEGDVIHAYAVCTCGTVYSERWVAGDGA